MYFFQFIILSDCMFWSVDYQKMQIVSFKKFITHLTSEVKFAQKSFNKNLRAAYLRPLIRLVNIRAPNINEENIQSVRQNTFLIINKKCPLSDLRKLLLRATLMDLELSVINMNCLAKRNLAYFWRENSPFCLSNLMRDSSRQIIGHFPRNRYTYLFRSRWS